MSGFTAGEGDGSWIASREQLREIIPEPTPTVHAKQIDHLDDNCRAFIAHSPFAMLATTHADGSCDASPRGGPPGFMSVIGNRYLVIPDYPGNRRNDSYENILSHPKDARAGLLVIIPGLDETLRIGGRIYLTSAPEILEAHAIDGRTPKLAVVAEVDEAFIHCAKAFKRSGMWDPDAWPSIEDMPSVAEITRDHLAIEELDADTIDGLLKEDYRTNMWPS